ncbi:unnamed protein product [Danaus chrysippus]|uniref:(African queen) hypothetical protein n=1 Tax=Danaus chrysippus TaxID=151541 RepID=A0A8J2W5I6_9NEOP|nr:unnamed protein product [Danaus chrysippus]
MRKHFHVARLNIHTEACKPRPWHFYFRPLHDPDTERSISCTAIGVAAFADTASDAYTQIIIRCRGALDCDLWTLCDKRVQYTDSAIILTLLFKK